jgi:hypothetical protein
MAVTVEGARTRVSGGARNAAEERGAAARSAARLDGCVCVCVCVCARARASARARVGVAVSPATPAPSSHLLQQRRMHSHSHALRPLRCCSAALFSQQTCCATLHHVALPCNILYERNTRTLPRVSN